MRLVEKFSASAESEDGRVVLRVGVETHVLSRERAAQLRRSLGVALTETTEFLHTSGEHREDGTYVVTRRRADSAGHRKVFDSFTAVEQLYEQLPAEFTAEVVGRAGLTGGRRHMLLRHFVEHPAFDCELTCRQPLTARKL